MVDFGNNEIFKILIDDYPLRRDTDILNKLVEEYKIDKLVLNKDNLGYSKNWKNAWNMIPDDIDYIWHQEDDFTFKEKVSVNKLIKILNNNKVQLFQIFLKRNIVYETGDYIRDIENNNHGEEIEICDERIVLCDRYFNANPCIYPYWIIKENYDVIQEVLINNLRDKYNWGYSAMFGSRNDENIVKHIGEYTQGKKVLPGEPGWEWMKEYDPTKKYFSNQFLKEYTN